MRQNYADPAAEATIIKDLGESSNTAAVAHLAADPEQFFVIDWIRWSYSDTPTGGKCTVAIGGVTVDEFDITVGGPGLMRYGPDSPLYANDRPKNQAVDITLAAGSGSVVGKVAARVR